MPSIKSQTTKSRWLHPLSMLACGVIVGVIGTVGIANAWPRARLAPVFYAKNPLHFGFAADGQSALCGDDGIAYTPTPNGELAYLARSEGNAIHSQQCRDKTP